MVTFELISTKTCTITGIGLLTANEPVIVDQVQADLFRAFHGYWLAQANFPTHVKITTVVVGGEN